MLFEKYNIWDGARASAVGRDGSALWRCTRNKGGISLFQKEISLPLTHPEKIAVPACSSKGCGAWGMEVPCVAALLRSPPLVVRDDLAYSYYPLPLC